ncbi:DNA binding protein [Dipodfec virus UOA04_Rod_843]|nr:DNA binding protein [Dipodfec virus UOA04_Rod_843]
MSRKRMPPRKDKRVFTRTAQRSKKININPTIYRGGIRL